ncbi:MAG: NAD(P)H-binding protein [Bryobacterales bacterium]|nr:NAD(P)H-binding protein [Bryobacterales bacterium]
MAHRAGCQREEKHATPGRHIRNDATFTHPESPRLRIESVASVFISGGTGYLGRHLIPVLLARGHTVASLARPGAERRLPAGCRAVTGDALRASTFGRVLGGYDTFIHLTGTPKPAPWKEREFRAVDLPSLMASADAAVAPGSGVYHFIYVSVAQPAPVMRAYVKVRQEAEAYLERANVPQRTVLRPWYVLGPGHWWPYALKPLYALAACSPRYCADAVRLGLVTIGEMTAALARAVDRPPAGHGVRIVETAQIRAAYPL